MLFLINIFLVINVCEDYKLSIIRCMTTISKSITHSVAEELYIKENAPKLCQMLYVLIEIAKVEKYKTLK